MTRKSFDKDYLLENSEAQAILNCYLVAGVETGIRFSEFEKLFKKNDLYSLLRKKIVNQKKVNANVDPKKISISIINNKTILKNRLKQMVNAGLLYQKKAKGPYFLKERWHNLPLKMLNKRLIDQTPLNCVSFDTPYPGIRDLSGTDFWCGTILYGIDLKSLPENYQLMILKETRAVINALARVDSIKHRLMEEWCINIIESRLGDNIINLEEALYSVMIDTAKLSIDIGGGELPSREWLKEIVEMYLEDHPLPVSFKSDTLIDTIAEMNEKLVKLYPFDDICLSSFGTCIAKENLSLQEVFFQTNAGVLYDRTVHQKRLKTK